MVLLECAVALNVHVETSSSTPIGTQECASGVLDFVKSIDGATAYNTAYSWTGTGSMYNWKVEPKNDRDPGCLEYSYSTKLEIPHFFEKYIGSLAVNIDIEKTTCANSTYVSDLAVVKTPMLIPEVRTMMHFKQRDRELLTRIEIAFELPWLLFILKDKISDHIMAKCQHKVHVLMSELCA